MTDSRHLSSLQLDALAQSTLDSAKRPAAEAHLATCADCRAGLETARGLRERFRREVFARTAPQIDATARFWPGFRLPVWLMPALAAACALLVIVALPLRRAFEPENTVKGTPTLRVFVHRGERTFQAASGDALHPGDGLRFEVEPAGLPYLLIASIDGAGHASVYFPYEGASSAAIAPGQTLMSPGSIVLDEVTGPERAFALLSKRPLPAGEVVKALEALGSKGAAAIRETDRVSAGADEQVSFYWEKNPP